uniref:Uncharacterized protein n=1 Tax=Anguilla anguilla TaxID=7936 RepID=A0A0E9XKV9_ANGAN
MFWINYYTFSTLCVLCATYSPT